MTTWRGLNFQGTDTYVPSGSGISPWKVDRFLKSWLGGPQLVIGIVMFSGVQPEVYAPTCRAIRKAGHKVMLRVGDSAGMADYTVDGFVSRHALAESVLGDDIDYVECANEVSGSRDDERWPGAFAPDKMLGALQFWRARKIPRVVTLFWNYDDPGYVWEWCARHPFEAEVVLMSTYPKASVMTPPPPSEIVLELSRHFPRAMVGIGEYGMQDANGTDRAKIADRLSFIEEFETRKLVCEKDLGGGFYWDAYEWLVQRPSEKMLEAFKDAWSWRGGWPT